LTDQSTIIFIFFADTPSQAARTHTRAPRAQKWSSLAPKSGLNPERFVA